MEEQLQQQPAQAPAPQPQQTPPKPMAQGKHTHASVWLLGILFVLTLLTLVAASIYFIQSNANLMREADIERQEKQDALTMLEEKETEALELAEELASAEIPEDAFIAYGGLIGPREQVVGTDPEIHNASSATYLGSQLQDWGGIPNPQNCVYVQDLAEGYNELGTNPEFWANEEVLSQVREYWNGYENVDAMIDVLISNDADGRTPFQICEAPRAAYATFSDIEHGYVEFFEKDTVQGAFWPAQPIILEGPLFTFFPEVIDERYSIAYSIYGDAGRLGWRYYVVDIASRSSTLVEFCTGGLHNFDTVEQIEEVDFACGLEYVPLEEAMSGAMMEDDSMMMEDVN